MMTPKLTPGRQEFQLGELILGADGCIVRAGSFKSGSLLSGE